MAKKKLPYPMIAVLAVDWTIYDDGCDIDDVAEEIILAEAWICGFLIAECDKRIVIGWEIFLGSNHPVPVSVRRKVVIPKSNIIKKIIFRGKK